MRRKDESKKPIIADFINSFYYEHDKVPSVREIVEGTGIPLSTVHRYLVAYMALRFWELLPVAPARKRNSASSKRFACLKRWSKREITLP